MGDPIFRCPRCGGQIQPAPGQITVVCGFCQSTIPQPKAFQSGMTPQAEQELQRAAASAKMNEAFSLLETDIASPLYDHNIKEAEGMFSAMVKDDKANYLAWSGLFGCMLHNCKKTFLKTEKIPGTEYWLQPGTNVFQDIFQVEGYFFRVVVDEHGKFRTFQYDSILQPGRKARLYLENAVESAEGEEKDNMQKLLDKYFVNAPRAMAKAGLETLTTQRVEARSGIEKRLRDVR